MIRIGYACINTKLDAPNRTCRLKNATPEKILELAAANVEALQPILDWNAAQGIELFRITAFDGAVAALPSLAGKRGVRLATTAACGAALVLGGGWWAWSGQSATPEKPRVAVMHFVNLGGDAAVERLAQGITQDVIIDLTRFRDLDVIALGALQASDAHVLAPLRPAEICTALVEWAAAHEEMTA